MSKKEKKNLAFIVGIAAVMFIALIGGSYAFLSIVLGGTKKVTVEVGTFEVSFEDSQTINLDNTYPMSNEKGMTTPSYKFTIKNTGTVNAIYDLALEEQSVGKNTLDKSQVKFTLKVDGTWQEPVLLSSFYNLAFLKSQALNPGEEIEYEIKIWLDEAVGNEAQEKEFKARVVLNAVQSNGITEDIVPPLIKLNGELSMNIKQGKTFTDPGVSEVTDDKDIINKNNVIKTYEYYDGVSTIEVDDIDTSKIGVYYIYYRVSDSAGNEGCVVRTVNVYKPDTNPPVITLNGDASQTIFSGQTYTELGATAIDPEEGDISHNIVVEGTVNSNREGTYIIKYLITDQSGNTASVTRTVIVNEIMFMLRAGSSSTSQDFNKYRANIKEIVFQQGQGIPAQAAYNWQVQDSKSEGIVEAYLIQDGSYYTLYIQSATGKIYANPTSSSLFYSYTALSKISNLNYFDTSKVTTMANMFYNCNKLVTLDTSHFNTSSVTTMGSMFENCELLQNLDLSSFNTSKVTTMISMFRGCKALKYLDVSSFDTSNVTTMNYTFYNCNNLITLGVTNFNTEKVTSMSYMFALCYALSELNLSSFNTSNVTNMSYMFFNSDRLTDLNLSNFNTGKVTTMASMFSKCTSLSQLNLGNFDTSKVTTMASMFLGCSGFTSLELGSFVTTSLTDMSGMFANCTNLVSLNLNNFNVSKVTTMTNMFSECTNLTSLNVINFETSSLTNISYMFDKCGSLTNLNINHFDTSKVTSMFGTFRGCSSLTTLNLSNWNTSNVTGMSSMFYDCTGFTDGLSDFLLTNFDTSKVTDMSYMFYNCSGLQRLRLSSFNTSKVTNMSYMFSGTASISYIIVDSSKWVMASNISNMFTGSGVSGLTYS